MRGRLRRLLALALSCAVWSGVADDALGFDYAVVLLYHHVADDMPGSTSVRIADFERHLETIEELGLTVRSLGDVIDAFEQGKRFAEPTVVITFDDAWRTIIVNAVPRLAERNWPSAIFASTDALDREFTGYATWDQLRDAATKGVTIENHSRDHGHLVEGWDAPEWTQRFRDNVTFASDRIEAEVGRRPRFFAWPFGEFDAGGLHELADMGLVGFGQQSGVVSAETVASEGRNAFVRSALPRFPISVFQAGDSAFRLRVLAAPLPATPARHEYFVAGEENPVLTLQFADEMIALEANCFDGSGTPIELVRQGRTVEVKGMGPVMTGRSKYTCTARNRARAGSFFWYSHPWFRPRDNGTFPD